MESQRTRRLFPLTCVAATVVVMLLSACNTTEGFGKDLEATGDNIKDAASDANN